MVDDISATQYFADRGFELVVEERDLHAEHMAHGDPGRASFFAEGTRYFCVSLAREGSVVAADYAHGETRDEALRRARTRYGTEQG